MTAISYIVRHSCVITVVADRRKNKTTGSTGHNNKSNVLLHACAKETRRAVIVVSSVDAANISYWHSSVPYVCAHLIYTQVERERESERNDNNDRVWERYYYAGGAPFYLTHSADGTPYSLVSPQVFSSLFYWFEQKRKYFICQSFLQSNPLEFAHTCEYTFTNSLPCR